MKTLFFTILATNVRVLLTIIIVIFIKVVAFLCAILQKFNDWTAIYRAQDLDFDTDKIWYYGSSTPITEFTVDTRNVGRINNLPGLCLLASKQEAEKCGAFVYELYTRINKPYKLGKANVITIPMREMYTSLLQTHSTYSEQKIIEKVHEFVTTGVFTNVTAIVIQHVLKAGDYDAILDGENLYIFDPCKIRVINAEFKATHKDSTLLTA